MLVALLAAACGAFMAAVAVAGEVVSDSTFDVPATHGRDTLRYRKIVFDEPVRFARLDSSGILLVAAERKRGKASAAQSLSKDSVSYGRTVAYDLGARRVKWAAEDEELSPLDADHGFVVQFATGTKHNALRRLADGTKVAEIPGNLFFADSEPVVVGIEEDAVSAYDASSGARLWRTDRGRINGPVSAVVERDGRLFVAAEGLMGIQLTTGQAWSYPMPTRRGQVTSTYGGMGFINTSSMGSLFGSRMVNSLSSRPLVRDGRVYFAAETTVTAFDVESGRCLWRRDLPRAAPTLRERAMGGRLGPQFLGLLELREQGENLVLASMGWAQGNGTHWKADPPTLALIRKTDGQVVRRVGLDGVPTLTDVYVTRRATWAAGESRLFAYDSALTANGAPRQAARGFFRSFIPCSSATVLLTEFGITRVDSSLTEIPMGVRAMVRDVPGSEDESEWETEPRGGWYLVTTSGVQHLDPTRDCEPVAVYPARFEGRAVVRHDVALLIAGRQVTVIPLGSRVPGLH